MALRALLREIWRLWGKVADPVDPARQILEAARTTDIATTMALARSIARDTEVDWSNIAEGLTTASRDVEPLLHLCLRRSNFSTTALLALAHWFAANGEPLRAVYCAQTLHGLRPLEPSPLILLGWVQISMGNPRAARRLFLSALQRDENSPEGLHGYRTAVKLSTGKPPAISPRDEEFEARLRERIAAEPENHSHPLALGKYYAHSLHRSLALPYLHRAYDLLPGDSETAYWLAITLAGMGDDRLALDIAAASLVLDAGNPGMLKLAAESALRLGEEARAMAWLRQVVELGAADASAFNNLGECHSQREEFEAAIPLFAKALELDPALTEARHNLAYALHCLGRYTEAYEQLEILLSADRNDFSARWYRSTTLLAAHCYREGWQDYEFRFVSTAVEGRLVPLPLWHGESLAGRKIVVVAEQGIGDEIMFASCLPDLIRLGGRCVIECNRRLVALYRRSFPQAEIVEWITGPSPPWLESHGDADFHVFCGSLPLHFRPTGEAFENAVPHLVADDAQVARFRARLDALGAGLKVGIAWRGGAKASRARTRSLRLDQLGPILDTPGCEFVSLQYGDCAGEVEEHARLHGHSLHHWPEAIADLDAFAALVKSLDLVVTVCSAPVHFAGGLGKPALVLTPFAPEWRYRGVAGKMVWYPSVDLFPQQALDDWSGAVHAVAERVRQAANTHAA